MIILAIQLACCSLAWLPMMAMVLAYHIHHRKETPLSVLILYWTIGITLTMGTLISLFVLGILILVTCNDAGGCIGMYRRRKKAKVVSECLKSLKKLMVTKTCLAECLTHYKTLNAFGLGIPAQVDRSYAAVFCSGIFQEASSRLVKQIEDELMVIEEKETKTDNFQEPNLEQRSAIVVPLELPRVDEKEQESTALKKRRERKAKLTTDLMNQNICRLCKTKFKVLDWVQVFPCCNHYVHFDCGRAHLSTHINCGTCTNPYRFSMSSAIKSFVEHQKPALPSSTQQSSLSLPLLQ